MKMRHMGLALGGALLFMVVGLVGCGGSGSEGGGTPATDLNLTGFWENPLNGQTAAGNMTQNGGNVTGALLLPPAGNGNLVGTVNGYHMEFTMAFDNGTTESGSGDFSIVNTGVDKLIFTGSLPSVGPFVISWRGPSFDQHTPAGQTLAYSPDGSTPAASTAHNNIVITPGTPAANLNATGFWEDPVNGSTAAGGLTQNGGSLSGALLLPPAGNGQITGGINGYHMDFAMAWDSGTTEAGSGDFSYVTNSTVDKLIFTGSLPSVGSFVISWRGPSFEAHNPAGQPLTYTPPASTW